MSISAILMITTAIAGRVRRISGKEVGEANDTLRRAKDIQKNTFGECRVTERGDGSTKPVNQFRDIYGAENDELLKNVEVKKAIKLLPGIFDNPAERYPMREPEHELLWVGALLQTQIDRMPMMLSLAMLGGNIEKLKNIPSKDLTSGMVLTTLFTPPKDDKNDSFIWTFMDSHISGSEKLSWLKKDHDTTKKDLEALEETFSGVAKHIREKGVIPATLRETTNVHNVRILAFMFAKKAIEVGGKCDDANPTKLPEMADAYYKVAKALEKVAEAMHAREKADVKEKKLAEFNAENDKLLASDDKKVKGLGIYRFMKGLMYNRFEIGKNVYIDNTISSMITPLDMALVDCGKNEEATAFYGLARDPIAMMLKEAMVGAGAMCMPDKLDLKFTGGGRRHTNPVQPRPRPRPRPRPVDDGGFGTQVP